ncbi:hypothetical protein E8E12_003445 [Didymella heteroderae]|uniref:Transmembrane transport n=1 Tax=Didymella heteroderae TaxID=1769908 RepID=A0A9P4X083_9PLEO|nr:hypothetical protein E8E12_003445 [Didymella heteroderae]
MATHTQLGFIDEEKRNLSTTSFEKDQGTGTALENIEKSAERAYVRKLDFYLLPFLSLMYFFNSVDRSNLGNAKTDGMDKDLGFKGEQYSLLILLFYIPNGLCDLPLNMLTKKWSGRVMLPTLMVGWGAMALFQCAAKNFAGMLVIRLLLGGFEAGFFAGTMTVIIALIAYAWLPAAPQSAWFLNEAERKVAERRTLRDLSSSTSHDFNLKECFKEWSNWKMVPWCIIAFTYPVAFSTTSNFLPQIVQRLGYSVVKTNLWTVAPNAVGFVILLCVTYSSDHFRERTFHIVFSLCVSLVGLIILASIDILANKGVAYFACFMLAAGAYIPSCLFHSWHNNNNLNENARAATTGLLVGLGNLGGIVSAATFRQEYAPKYIPTLAATAACNATCIIFTLCLGGWMKLDNRRRNKQQCVKIRAEEVRTSELGDGERSEMWRYFT